MKANTALALLLGGLSLRLWQYQSGFTRAATLAKICGGATTLIGLTTLGEYAFGSDFGIDQLLVTDAAFTAVSQHPGRMAPHTAFCAVFLGLALLFLDVQTRKGHRPSQVLCLPPAFISLMALTGYLYSVVSFYRISSYTGMAVHTALLIFALSLGILTYSPRSGLLTVVTADSFGGIVARRLILPALVIPFFLGWVRMEGQKAGLYGTEFGIALFATSNVVVFVVLVWQCSVSLHRADLLRRSDERERAELAAIVTNSDDAIIGRAVDGRITSWNRGADRLYGYTSGEMIGQNIDRIIPPERLDEEARILATLQRGAGIEQYESQRRTRGGKIVDVSITASPIRDERGEIIGISKIARNISESKRSREALQKYSLRLASLHEIDRAILAAQSPREIAGAALDRIRSIFDCRRATLLLFDLERQTAEFVAVSGADDLGTPTGSVFPLETFTSPESLRPALGRKIDDLQGIPDPSLSLQRLLAAGMRSALNIPLMAGDEMIGSLNFSDDHVAAFDDEHHSIARELANQLAVAIHHARAEEALGKSEAKFSKVFHASPDSIVISTLKEGRYIDVNDSFTAMTGFTRDEVLGRTAKELGVWMDPEGRTRMTRILEDEGVLRNFEFQFRTKSGETRTGLRSAFLYEYEGETCVIGVTRDITEIKKSQDKIRLGREWLQAILEGSRDGIVVEQDGQIVFANREYAQLFGYTDPSELVRQPVSILINPSDHERLVDYSAKRLRGESVPSIYEYEGRHKDGKLLKIEASVSTVTIGSKQYIISVERDVTERKIFEEQLRQSQKMQAVGQLAGGVAHDFNNLLGIIIGYAQILQQDNAIDESAKKKLQLIREAGNTAASLTKQLLAFSRQQVLQPAILELNAAVEHEQEFLRRLLSENIDLRIVLGEGVGRVNVDSTQLQQVLMNLAVNARDAMPEGGTLTIATTNIELDEVYQDSHQQVPAGSYVMLSVSDTGVGMDEQTQARVFEPFFTTKSLGKGTGLGLATVYGVVKQSGGFIWVYSEPGKGTTFKVYFHRILQAAEKRCAEVTSPEDLAGTETILVVEDADSLRELIAETLKPHGYKVIEAANGAEALAVAENHAGPVHLLLTDVVMPLMSGRELSHRLQSIRPEIRILFISGYTSDTIIQQGIQEDAAGFLQKPFGPVELAQKVRLVLG